MASHRYLRCRDYISHRSISRLTLTYTQQGRLLCALSLPLLLLLLRIKSSPICNQHLFVPAHARTVVSRAQQQRQQQQPSIDDVYSMRSIAFVCLLIRCSYECAHVNVLAARQPTRAVLAGVILHPLSNRRQITDESRHTMRCLSLAHTHTYKQTDRQTSALLCFYYKSD